MSPTGGTPWRRSLPEPVVFALLLLAALAMLAWTWRSGPDPLVDFGHELYIPWQLSKGRVLYRDVAYFEGPLSPYWNAALFRLFGVGLTTLVWANLAVATVLLVLIHAIARRLADGFAAALAGLVFVLLFAFGQYTSIGNYNYLTPYAHPLVHGVVLSAAAVLCWLRFLEHARPGWLAGSGLLAGAVLLTKPEPALALFAGLACGFVARGMPRASRLRTLREGLAWLALAALPPALAFALLGAQLGAREAGLGILGSWKYLGNFEVASLPFYRWGMGTDHVGLSLAAMVLLGIVYAGFLGALLALARRGPGGSRLAALGVFAVSTTGTGLLLGSQAASWLRPLPLALGVVAALLVARVRREGETPAPRSLGALVVVTFSLVLLAKMFLNSRLFHYGFVLAMPGTLVCLVALVHGLPARLRRQGRRAGVFRAAGLGVAAGAVAAHLGIMAELLSRRTVEVGSGPDAFLADERGETVNQALEWIGERMGPDETLAVFPVGAMIGYLAKRDNPTPFVFFMPPEVILFGEDRMLASLRDEPPDFVLVLDVDGSEYGRRFGIDYAMGLADWLGSTYQAVERTPGGGMELRRRSRATPRPRR